MNEICKKPQRRAEPSRGIWNEFTALVFVHTIGDSLFLCVCVFGDKQLAWLGAAFKEPDWGGALLGANLSLSLPTVWQEEDKRARGWSEGGWRGGGWH